jgi:hypothetical protein
VRVTQQHKSEKIRKRFLCDLGNCQLSAYATQLRRCAAQRELVGLGRREVPVHRMRDVDADPAVHVDGGVRDPVPGVAQNFAL